MVEKKTSCSIVRLSVTMMTKMLLVLLCLEFDPQPFWFVPQLSELGDKRTLMILVLVSITVLDYGRDDIN